MTNKEAIQAVREGRRAYTDTTLRFTPEELAGGPRCGHRWRTVACDNETDVIECSRCGAQRLCACDFDEEFA